MRSEGFTCSVCVCVCAFSLLVFFVHLFNLPSPTLPISFFPLRSFPSLTPSPSIPPSPSQPEPPEIDLGQLGVLKSIHHSIRLRSRHPTALATLTENALKKVYSHVSSYGCQASVHAIRELNAGVFNRAKLSFPNS